MSATQEAFITPKIVRWARERLGETIETTAHRLKIQPQRVRSWEEGTELPTLRQAKRLAKKLSIPFGYLFLTSPPEVSSIPLPDFRTVSVADTSEASPDFIDLFNDVLVKHDWYKQYLLGEGQPPLKFVGRFSPDSPVTDVAESINETLEVEKHRDEAVSWSDFLRQLTRSAESAGAVVMKSGVVGANNKRVLSVDEFRGFAIADPIAPLVFINGRDAISAQIFTLIHELAHIWIGSAGISRPDMRKKSSRQINAVERFCDEVAAEVLVPRHAFLRLWDEGASIDSNVHRLGSHFHVSSVVILRRAYDLDELGADEYLPRFEREWRHEARPKSDGGNFYATIRVRNSNTLTDALVEGALQGRVLLLDAAKMLKVKIGTIEKLSERLAPEKP